MENTQRFLDALERRDLDTAIAMLDPEVTWTTHMAPDGSQTRGVTSGREQVAARLRELGSWFDKVSFVDRRTSLVAGSPADAGVSTFVQTNGDFQTRDGRAYRNVYVFRFDWRDGRMSVWEEYANPVTIRHLEQGQ